MRQRDPREPNPQINPQRPDAPQNLISIDPGTLLAIVVAVLFIPLLLAGLFSH